MTITGKHLITVLLAVLALLVIALFSMYIWPTRYRYARLQITGSGNYPVRIDRFTGEAEMLTRVGWRHMNARNHWGSVQRSWGED